MRTNSVRDPNVLLNEHELRTNSKTRCCAAAREIHRRSCLIILCWSQNNVFPPSPSQQIRRFTNALCFLVLFAAVIASQNPEASGQDGPLQVAAESASPKGQSTAPPDTAKPPGTPPKEGGAPATPAANAPAANPAPAQDTVKRPTAEKYVPQKIDIEIRKNPDGLVTFNIVGQPWEAVLQWLSDASALSFDWQELPGDSLNLITTHEYTMEQARDLINRHLLMRGFTMIING